MIVTGGIGQDRTRAALASLSAVGAAIAGCGVAVIFAEPLAPLGWPVLAAGAVVHLFGMIGIMRLQSAKCYQPSALEKVGYWVCWAVILALLAYAGLELAR